MQQNPEIGLSIDVDGIETNYHDVGQGHPVLMIHGSGPGVSGFVNWRLAMPELAKSCRVIVPDMLGFGYSARSPDGRYTPERWVAQAVGLMDALGVQQADIVGNSFGGALALMLAIRHPQRIRRLVLMGAAGIDFELTPGLDAVWGYEPSMDDMRRVMDIFAFDRARITEDIVRSRFEASVQPGAQEAFSAMFPAPRQRWVQALASPEAAIRAIEHETLIIHGREDRVIPLGNSLRLCELIPRAQLHVYGRCGHWTQIEHAGRFARLVRDFLTEQ
ncbi:alpha/beta fold hydrolase [Thauera sinica]|uniref:Alpha/beta fold hydrolase n=1 Tax=Thauera sinica TaxID=2665146 RepID=A0ABW1AL62_9RHOO|nr:alpha/beta hydrolase [Thauera sp. K11]ATE62089.1 2-hydroxy-6-oxo-2,4-heptadienoate hydrolase [Thauera sp. K11]